MQPNRNKTVLIVGGLRGNDFLGPTAILNLYGKVKAGKIIYFPLANPSGFMRQQIEAYPTNVNIE
jgi:predicted deacylase